MEQIRVVEKPDWASWDEVQQCIHDAQVTNNKKGFDMKFGHLSGSELKEKIGNGYCFVALNDEKKVVGTLSIILQNIHFWWHKGMASYHCYEGILPQYRGTDVYFDLHDAVEKKESDLGIKVMWADTAEKNKVVLRLIKKKGWKVIRYTPNGKGCDYYSVIFARWVDGCPYSDSLINFMYNLSRITVRVLYKPGKKLRFAFWK